MAVAFDARFLFFLFDPEPAGGPLEQSQVSQLFENLSKSREQIIVPTPALAELLVGAGDNAARILEELDKKSIFQIEGFGTRAAVELAARERDLVSSGIGKRDGLTHEPYQKIKFDRQICAIAKVAGASTIYSQDASLRHHAKNIGLKAVSVQELPKPIVPPQMKLPF